MPKIDLRDFQSLLEEKRSIVPLYTPEWDATDDRDTGVALLKIFTHMQEEIINRLNRVPEKNFTAFLEMIGLKLMPAQPAKAPVTFYLPEGLSGGAFVPAGTKVAADETDKHKVLNFETTNGIFATSATIQEIYRVDPNNDSIFRYTDDYINKREFLIFKNEGTKEELNSTATDFYPENKQEHILYLGHKELFDLDSATIEFYFNSDTVDAGQLENFIWEYWGENEELITVDSTIAMPENNSLKLTIVKAIGEKEICGVKTRWIRCIADKVSKSMALPVIKRIQIKVGLDKDKSIRPNIGFLNQIPLDLSKDGRFYIFGQQPRLFDTFYIASREAFSKKNAVITIIFIRNVDKNKNPDKGCRTLSWEYWNGKIWYALSIKENKLNDFMSKEESGDYSGSIEFECPKDIEEIEVNGVKSYWIRVRLAEGDYGHNEYVLIPADDGGTKEHWEVEPKFNPPIVNKIDIHYSMDETTDLQDCLLSNNLEYIDLTQESKHDAGLKLFTPLAEKYPTLYIGFKEAFKKGNISIFFSLKDMDYPFESRPEIKWTYWSKAPNLMSTAGEKDITLASTKGIDTDTELLFEEKIGSETITGTAIVDSLGSNGKITLKEELNHKYTEDVLVFKRTNLEVTDNTEYLTKTGTLEFIGSPDQSKTHKFGIESYWLMGEFIKPGLELLIKGIYPNTVWAEQVETIKDEILGSGGGEKNESYSFFRVPVISPEIWIKYEDIISENVEDATTSEDIKKIKDDTGKIIEKWVRWKIVDDFADSGPRSKHCTIDNSMGTVQFGDGEHGLIPPIGRDNIKATYKTGGGVLGNVAKNEIKTLKSSIAGIDHITNHEPAEGGSDTELLSEIFERGPHLIKHRDRAVTREDFERLAKAASSYIARTKCLVKGNKLTVIVIPKGEEDKPEPSRGLKEVVRKSLLERSLNIIPEKSLEIAGPSYKEIKVEVGIIPESIDQAIPLEKTVFKRLKEYLHPLTGGNEGTGWEFGRDIHISDIYALLESIKGVDHVENLKLNNSCKDVSIEEFETVCSGEHEVTMRLGS